MVSGRMSGAVVEAAAAVVCMSCECCGLEEECTGEYVGGVRACFGGRWLCGLCSEAVKYEAARRCAGDVEGAVHAHAAFCRMLRRGGGPAERVAEGMCQMLRTASGRHRTAASSSSPPPISAARHRRSASGNYREEEVHRSSLNL